MFQRIKPILLSVLSVIIATLVVVVIVFAWEEPTQIPPGGNVDAPLNVGPIGQAKKGNLMLNTDGALANGLLVFSGNVGIGTIDPDAALHIQGGVCIDTDDVCTDPGAGNLTVGGGSGKINAGVIDPVFDIGGKKYSTYMPDYAGGTRIETAGLLEIKGDEPFKNVIDFDNLKEGSNLWLFWQASNKNIKDLTVLLASNFDGRVWYEKEGNKLIIYGSREGEVSFKLSAPRVDYQNWQNLTDDQSLEGIKILK
jgi:hypothetical protein